jgi:hypothetical protein
MAPAGVVATAHSAEAVEAAHKQMQEHMPQDGNPAVCMCHWSYPCPARYAARKILVDVGHLVLADGGSW